MADNVIDIRDFYAHLLGLVSPWTVKAVIVAERSEEVEVHLVAAEGARFPCPVCDRKWTVCAHSPVKTWRHLDTCGKTTLLHARIPMVNCTEHGKRQPRLPWGDPDFTATRAFELWVAPLAKGFGDTKKAAQFARVEPAGLRCILRRSVEESGKPGAGPTDGDQSTCRTSSEPRARQLSLFARNDMTFINQGVQAFRNMELEKAVELFEKHRKVYPKGYDISSRLAVADFLLRGIREAPAEPSERPGHLCRLWNSFEDFVKSDHLGREAYTAEIKSAFFARVIEEAERCGLADCPSLPGDFPLGYILLQAQKYEEAIVSLQSCIPEAPHNAALYGYLGDAYWLRGDREVARQCYREACLIDPAGIDWRHLQDEDLKELKQDLWLEYGLDPELALAWLPSHARINGLFERKVVRLHEGLKEMVDEYLALEKALSKGKSPKLAARIFFRGMILCENGESLKFVKKIELMQVRRIMKEANPNLFADFLKLIVGGKRGG